MVSVEELENLQGWLRQYSAGYLLLTKHGEFITAEAIQQLAESCDALEIEDQKVYLNWVTRTASPIGSKFESVAAIPDVVNPRIQLEPTFLTFEEYMERSPGDIELSSGYLGSSIESAFDLLDITLETFGLLQVVRRAPPPFLPNPRARQRTSQRKRLWRVWVLRLKKHSAREFETSLI